ncbi:hypothetical protein APHAL10511_001953 [Amanita phalloides]|nr:hypothetical protein APHAL10511_001953 [Amanita phalloides]
MFPLLFLLLPLVHAAAIHHRLFHPKASHFDYSLRSHIALDSSTFSIHDDISSHFLTLREQNLDLDNAFYQVALQRDGDLSDSQWDVASVKLCHLYNATSDTIVLHVKGKYVHAMDYFVDPAPHNGACPKRKGKKKLRSIVPPELTYIKLNTTIITETSRKPPTPELRTPPALTVHGEPVKPIPEKSFLQKYWIYIVPLVILLLASGGPENDQPQRRQQAG